MLEATLEGVGFWCSGLPSWQAACEYLRLGVRPEAAPARPTAQLLAANERRRAPETVAVALEVALAACHAADRDPASLPSVFTSTHGDLAITDYMCAALADDPRTISPTRFHNSVHNAAAGYWTIGAGALPPATALSAHEASFAQGLLEALAQLASGSEAVLLVGYDSQSTGPLGQVSPSRGLLGGALLLSQTPSPGRPRLQVSLSCPADPPAQDTAGALARWMHGNAMQPMLPLFEALALGRAQAQLAAGNGQWLSIGISHD
ncbi:beta-ketoacyl synthase chain length factor [Stenotrophomonas sp. YIM B06876]|uniref:beta-ketoacyl synthase chain length factor n=1 Tax=Stenotrophomonas sp. YIM B06876 TaxID=3060211 RepID=UPI0027391BAB|nr:beta-ketoacyl synthase chain length factor [Stenotrophomonas sp. YIM B06876]